jgi:hypothetical protein
MKTWLFLLSLLLSGCASTTLRSGRAPGDSPPGFSERWHSAFLFGTVEASGPYDLDRICPQGWAEVTVEPDPFTTLVGLATFFLYSPNRITVVCGAPGSSARPPAEGAGLPPAPQRLP